MPAPDAEFPTAVRGYAREAVDELIRELRRDLLRVSTQNGQLATELREAQLALADANEQLRALLKGVAQQAFGTRSERSSVLFGDQGLLDLQDFGWPVASDAASLVATAGVCSSVFLFSVLLHATRKIEAIERAINDFFIFNEPCCKKDRYLSYEK